VRAPASRPQAPAEPRDRRRDLAELVQLRAAGELEAGTVPVLVERHEEIDPVCHMTVKVSSARYRATHDDRTYYFCSAGCLERFSANPAAFLTAPAP
jgi:YHS domain-containing protein